MTTYDGMMDGQVSDVKQRLWAFATMRAMVIFLAAFLLLFSFHYGAAYFSSQQAQEKVDTWFAEGNIPLHTDVVEPLAALQQADDILLSDARTKLSLAKLYILLAQTHNSGAYLQTAHNLVRTVKALQPTHFEADTLMVVLAQRQPALSQHFEYYLHRALKSGGLEQTSQLILGPVVVESWKQLPQELQQLAGPMIKSMLSEADVREVLFNAMHKAKLYRPFAKFSPNRKTSTLLKKLQKERG
ncbi:hypothetical protein OPS25_13275 [Alteromonas ponticola]|uniref:Tetratricopeptide repeat-like domain-containing protein n=1 Tax=Alteromonas aquimaris TaxID=2998417 RepID=A0ABT3P9U1_9ALTE|nr:hypothetical protein [Alteromonas aquimaris]MCW8109475.1 hypothetical protein [Alteromonas aquimaris]